MSDPAPKVLVVDDNPLNRDLLVRRLAMRGYDAESVESGLEALERIAGAGFDAVLLDMMMPVIDGTETLNRIRAVRSNHQLPVIMVTAKDDAKTVAASLRAGANDYVTKPIDFEVLFARLSNQIGLKAAKEELQLANRELEERIRDRTAALELSNDNLIHSESQLRAILDNAADGVVSIDATGRILSFNRSAQKIFGYAAEDVVGRNVAVLMPDGEAARHDASISRYVDGTGPAALIGKGARQLIGKRSDGAEFPLEISLGEVCSSAERLFVGIIRDVSEKEEMEKRLRQSQKMEAVGRLTGGVAHDFNNLLTVIMGNLQLLERSLKDNEKALNRIGKVMGAAKSGAELTRRLLSFSRQQVLETKVVDINELVGDLEKLLQRTMGEEIVLSTSLGPGDCRGVTDQNQLENALLNLCINARDAMPDGGRLSIETRVTVLDQSYAGSRVDVEPGAYVEVAVSDTGSGIPPEILEKVFEPFFTTKESGKGTGLGLSTVFGFMKQSGGHVGVYSEVGYGTTFKLYIPLAAADAAIADDTRPEAELHRSGATVLVVEDDERVREIAVALLGDEGYRVIEAESGPSGLSAFSAHPDIDVVFSDVVMPGGMTGPEMVEKIRDLRPGIPVLFASGYAEQALRGRDGLMMASGFVAKPYDVNEIPKRLETLMEAKK